MALIIIAVFRSRIVESIILGIFCTTCSPGPNSFPTTNFTTKLGRQGCRRKTKNSQAQMTAWITTILIIITLLAILYTIFKKCALCILITKGVLPLVPIQHDTPRHRAHRYFHRGCKLGFGGSHVGAFRIRHSPPFAIKDHRLPPCLQHAYYKTLLLPTAAGQLAEYNSVRFGPKHN